MVSFSRKKRNEAETTCSWAAGKKGIGGQLTGSQRRATSNFRVVIGPEMWKRKKILANNRNSEEEGNKKTQKKWATNTGKGRIHKSQTQGKRGTN